MGRARGSLRAWRPRPIARARPRRRLSAPARAARRARSARHVLHRGMERAASSRPRARARRARPRGRPARLGPREVRARSTSRSAEQVLHDGTAAPARLGTRVRRLPRAGRRCAASTRSRVLQSLGFRYDSSTDADARRRVADAQPGVAGTADLAHIPVARARWSIRSSTLRHRRSGPRTPAELEAMLACSTSIPHAVRQRGDDRHARDPCLRRAASTTSGLPSVRAASLHALRRERTRI